MGYPESPRETLHQPAGGAERQMADSNGAGGDGWAWDGASHESPRRGPSTGVKLFSACPPLSESNRSYYGRQVAEVAQWSEEAGFQGTLVYTDNSMLDPWLVAQIVIENTRTLCPLVAVQPAYMHPYAVAKMVTSLGAMYGRGVALNRVAGGFKND